MAKNTATVDLTIRHAKVMTDDGNMYTESEGDLNFKNYLSSRFLIFLDSTDISGTENMEKRYEESEFDTINYQMDGQTGSVLTLVLYNERYLKGSNKISYGTISGGNMTDVIAYLCTNAGINNILFSPATSGKIPPQFVIPPMTLFDQLEYLQKEFSIHQNGTMVFFDLERAYIIDRDASCTAYATNEYKRTYIISASNIGEEWGSSAGCYDNSSEKYYACTIFGDSIPINDDSSITEHSMGSNLIYVDSSTGETYNINGSDGSVNGVVYGVKNTNNYKAMQHKIRESGNVITVILQGINLNAVTPNKEFVLLHANKNKVFESTSYRLSSLNISFGRRSKFYTVNAVCVFKSTQPRK
jgi:hypothetical protein